MFLGMTRLGVVCQPALIEEQHGMGTDRDVGRDLLEMPLHRHRCRRWAARAPHPLRAPGQMAAEQDRRSPYNAGQAGWRGRVQLSKRPSGRSSLNRCTQSRKVWRSMPPILVVSPAPCPQGPPPATKDVDFGSHPSIAGQGRGSASGRSSGRRAHWRTRPFF